MRFLVSALGSAGDVHPFIAISQALVARGHRVRLMAAPPFEDRVRRAGIDFAPMGAPGDYERMVRRADLWHPRRGARLLLDELLNRLPEAVETTSALVTANDTVLVGSSLSWAMRIVQELRGLPAATVHLSPMCLPSALAPPVLPGVGDLRWVPAGALRRLQWVAERLVTDRLIGPRLNRVRADLGLPPVRHILSRWLHSPDLVVGAWPEWFAATAADWPPRTHTTGFPMFGEAAELGASLDAFLAAGTAPVGITPGSAMAHGGRFFARAVDACGAIGRRALLITPYREQLPSLLPAWAHHVPYAPFGPLLPRLAVLVHHGGIGTSAQAMAAAVPQLVVPFAYDQFDNAARLRRLGISLTLDASAPPATWADALRTLVCSAEIAVPVQRQAARIAAAEPPVHAIARLLEGLGASGCNRAKRWD